MDVAIVADDLTGAADAAVAFADGRTRAEVQLRAAGGSDADVLAVDTATRDQDAAAAGERVAAAVRRLAPLQPACWFKKVDSTLRGHVAAEVAAFAGSLGGRRLVVAPAYPRQGRVTLGGLQHVVGRPVADDQGDCHLPTLLAPAGLPILSLSAPEAARPGRLAALLAWAAAGSLCLCDAASDDDLDRIVVGAWHSGVPVGFVGSAGLAEALYRARCGAPCRPATPAYAPDRALLLVGTLHPASRGQLGALARCRGLSPIMAPMGPGGDEPARLAALIGRVDAALRSEGVAVLATPADPVAFRHHAIAEELAGLAADCIRATGVRRVFVTGGEVARALCDAFAVTRLAVRGRVDEGVPALEALDGLPGLELVTKAGGFGDEGALLRILACLDGRGGQP